MRLGTANAEGPASEMAITVTAMRTRLQPVRKIRPFVDWMLRDNLRVFKKYDRDRSGSIDLGELEFALEEYFDQVVVGGGDSFF